MKENNSNRVSFRVPGKWVLTGEHSVLRGSPAIVLPLHKFYTELSWTPRAHHHSPCPHLKPLAEYAETLIRKPLLHHLGEIAILSTIPIGAGLGSSAALCVAFSKWIFEMYPELSQPLGDSLSLAVKLEHFFHGRSSGMDIHAVGLEKPILFQSGKVLEILQAEPLSHFTFHDTGFRGKTKDCIQTVTLLQTAEPQKASLLDQRMTEASLSALHGLKEKCLEKIAHAMHVAQDCFESWGLTNDAIRTQRDILYKQGALAVKLTGSGQGGYLVALWRP